MGTRSIIGTATDNGFEGRYCHWDGYPTARGRDIARTYAELGRDLEAVKAYAIRPGEPGYWSAYMTPSEARANSRKPKRVKCDLCSGTGVRPNGLELFGAAWVKSCNGCNGCRGTGKMLNPRRHDGYRTDNGDSWATNTDDWGAEWAYLLSDAGIDVLVHAGDNDWRRAGFVPWGDAPETDWLAIENRGDQVAAA